jgi:hypothetical protein
VNLDENQLLVNLLLVGLVVDVQQNRDALNLDVVLTLVDVRLDGVDVVQVDVALHLHRIQKDCFQHVVDVALLKELKESMELKELMQQQLELQE